MDKPVKRKDGLAKPLEAIHAGIPLTTEKVHRGCQEDEMG